MYTFYGYCLAFMNVHVLLCVFWRMYSCISLERSCWFIRYVSNNPEATQPKVTKVIGSNYTLAVREGLVTELGNFI